LCLELIWFFLWDHYENGHNEEKKVVQNGG